jgi:hypothetical protein
MVKERVRLSDLITEEDNTLKQIVKECSVIGSMQYVGNLSSLFFFPILKRIFYDMNNGFNMFEANIWLYYMDNVLKFTDCIYIVMSYDTASRKIGNDSIFNHLLKECFTWYYDGDTVVCVYRVPTKLQQDYKRIVTGDLDNLSMEYTSQLSQDGIVRSLIIKNPVVQEQWDKLRELLYDEKDRMGEILIPENSFYPKFNIEMETYYARKKDKKDGSRKR